MTGCSCKLIHRQLLFRTSHYICRNVIPTLSLFAASFGPQPNEMRSYFVPAPEAGHTFPAPCASLGRRAAAYASASSRWNFSLSGDSRAATSSSVIAAVLSPLSSSNLPRSQYEAGCRPGSCRWHPRPMVAHNKQSRVAWPAILRRGAQRAAPSMIVMVRAVIDPTPAVLVVMLVE